MNADKVLALAKTLTDTPNDQEYVTLHCNEVIKFAALIQQQMEVDGWRSPEQVKKAVEDERKDTESEQRWATHYATKMHKFEVVLRNLEQAYSNKHSPQHRRTCLLEARSLLNPVIRARSANE